MEHDAKQLLSKQFSQPSTTPRTTVGLIDGKASYRPMVGSLENAK